MLGWASLSTAPTREGLLWSRGGSDVVTLRLFDLVLLQAAVGAHAVAAVAISILRLEHPIAIFAPLRGLVREARLGQAASKRASERSESREGELSVPRCMVDRLASPPGNHLFASPKSFGSFTSIPSIPTILTLSPFKALPQIACKIDLIVFA